MLPFIATIVAVACASPAATARHLVLAYVKPPETELAYQTFQLAGPPRLRVTVPSDFRYNDDGDFTVAQSTVVIRWTEGQIDCRQAVKLPAKWAPWTYDTPLTSQPTAVSWTGRPYPTIVIAAFRESGVYGVRAPIVMEFHKSHWEVVNLKPEAQEFTNRGSFFIRRNRLYVWDYEADSKHAHSAPQRYWLKTFRVRGHRLVLTRVRMTRHRYPSYDLESFPNSRPIPAHDPLREFGLRFHWWSRSK